MRTRRWIVIGASMALAVAPLGCGSDDAGDSHSAAVPTAEQLAARLLTAADLAGTWTVNPGPDDAPMPASGVVTDEARAMMPKLELCPAASAESRAAAADVRWTAFCQLDMTPDDPIVPPADRTGHMVFVQEFLFAADEATITSTFELLRDGMHACLGPVDTGDEGPGTATEMTVPAVGDDRYGVLTTVQEAGRGGEWLLHDTLVREGSVLMMIDVVDIHIGVGPLFTSDDVATIVTAATERL